MTLTISILAAQYYNEVKNMAKTFEFNGKTYNFAEDIQVPQEGLFEATLVDENNHRCEMIFRNGKLFRLTELD